MKTDKTEYSRRKLLKLGIGAAGVLVASKGIAEVVCADATDAQGLGPFFPDDGDPRYPIRENPDPTIPIALANDNDLTFVKGKKGEAQGQVVFLKGILTDSECKPVAGASIVIWQASETGLYNHKRDDSNLTFKSPKRGDGGKTITREHDKSFQYWGRTITDEKGRYLFKTIIPGYYPADINSGWFRPPHIHVKVSPMGSPPPEPFVTQTYFKGEAIKNNDWIQELNKLDWILRGNPKLIIEYKKDASGLFGEALVGEFPIQLP